MFSKLKVSYKIVLLLVLIVLSIKSYSQSPIPKDGGAKPGSRDSSMRNMPIGKIFGILRDSSSKQPLEFASVALIRLKDSIAVGGSLSDEKGRFSIADINPGRYRLSITTLGYGTYSTLPILIKPDDPTKDIGIINMVPTLKNLKEATVTGEKAEYINNLDKKVYNVDKNLINVGGNVSEVLQNIPSVNVDIDGKVSLRGSENVTILIDGKPSGLTSDNRANILQQLPASSIEQVEVITNPSSKYDAEGTAGIINIKTRKDKTVGLNGTATAGIGTNNKYNGSLNLNRRSQKSNFYVNYGYRYDDRNQDGKSLRTNTYNDTITYLDGQNSGNGITKSHTLRAGNDWFLNDYNTFGVSGGISLRDEMKEDDATTNSLDQNKVVESGYDRYTDSDEDGNTIDGSLDYRKTFPGTKRELTSNVNVTVNDRKETNNYTTIPFSDAYISMQRQNTTTRNITGSGQFDYSIPFEKFKLETGAKVTLRNNDSEILVDRFDSISDSWNVEDIFSDNFVYNEMVYAGYGQITGKVGIFDLAAGLRAELSDITGENKEIDTSFNKTYLNLFPTAAFKYIFSEKLEMQLGYSKRINRPGSNQLNPATSLFDSLNVMRGNPNLDPEYIQSLELSSQMRKGEHSLTATLYYRYIDNFIQRFRTIDTATDVSYQTFLNYNYSQNLGFELVMRNQIGKKVSATTNFNFFRNWADASNIQEDLKSDIYSWDIRCTVNWKIAKSTSIQLTGNYMAPRQQPQGRFIGMSGVDFGLKHDLPGGKWSFNLAVTDIFDTKDFSVRNTGENFTYEFERKRETRVATLTVSYRFGKADVGQSRKKQSRPDQGSSEGMDF